MKKFWNFLKEFNFGHEPPSNNKQHPTTIIIDAGLSSIIYILEEGTFALWQICQHKLLQEFITIASNTQLVDCKLEIWNLQNTQIEN